MKKAKQDGKRASMVKDKLYIDGTLYRPTVQEEGTSARKRYSEEHEHSRLGHMPEWLK